MFKKKNLKVLSMAVLLSLLVAAVMPFAVLADDGVTPPTDAPAAVVSTSDVPAADVPAAAVSVTDAPAAVVSTSDVPAADVPAAAVSATDAPAAEVSTSDVPSVDAPAVVVAATEAPVVDVPTADAPAVDAQPAEDLTVPEVLDALPEGTNLVVVDSTGDALPLASQEAADTLDSPSADPFFWDGTQYVGYSASGVCPAQVTVCNTSATPLQAAITAFGASSTATGSIYVAAGTYAANVTIDGNVGSNTKNLTGLIGEGSATTTLNGDVMLQNMNMGTNVFTFQGFTLNGGFSAMNNTNTLNITDIVQNGSLFSTGFNIQSHTGDVTFTDVDSSRNSYGAFFTNVGGNVTITTSGGTSTFNNNDTGFYVGNNRGSITVNDVAITNGRYGFRDFGGNTSTPILNCDTFSGQFVSVSGTVNQTSVGCGSGGTGGGSAYVPFPAVPVAAPLVGGGSGNENQPAAAPYIIIPQTQSQLPATLDNGNAFGSALKVELTGQTSDLSITLSFPIPDGKQNSKLSVMFWDGAHWVAVSGGSVVNGKFVITVSAPGTYVLVVQ